jgi:hypothetical protein
MLAASSGDTESVCALLSKGADPSGRYIQTGKTALKLAKENKHADIVELLSSVRTQTEDLIVDIRKGKSATNDTESETRSRASTKALKPEGHSAASRTALSRQASSAAARRSAASRSRAAKKAAATRQK